MLNQNFDSSLNFNRRKNGIHRNAISLSSKFDYLKLAS